MITFKHFYLGLILLLACIIGIHRYIPTVNTKTFKEHDTRSAKVMTMYEQDRKITKAEIEIIKTDTKTNTEKIVELDKLLKQISKKLDVPKSK